MKTEFNDREGNIIFYCDSLEKRDVSMLLRILLGKEEDKGMCVPKIEKFIIEDSSQFNHNTHIFFDFPDLAIGINLLENVINTLAGITDTSNLKTVLVEAQDWHSKYHTIQ